MGHDDFILAGIDIAPADRPRFHPAPFAAEDLRFRAGCNLPGNGRRGGSDGEEGRLLGMPLDPAWLGGASILLLPEKSCEENQVGIPWGRPGTDYTELFEALVLALLRRMPLKDAAAVLAKLDDRLWRLVPFRVGEKGESGKETGCLRIGPLGSFFDLESSFIVTGAGGTAEAEKMGWGLGEPKELCRLFLMAVIEAFLKGAMVLDLFRLIRDRIDTNGKVSAEVATLYPSQSRAPPKPPKPTGWFSSGTKIILQRWPALQTPSVPEPVPDKKSLTHRL
jgi:hypothetical protein